MAKVLKNRNLPVDFIIEVTGLTLAEIENLNNKDFKNG
jgi:hypothetical protein